MDSIKTCSSFRLIHGYKCYLPNKEGFQKCHFMMKTANYHCPRFFKWTAIGNEVDLEDYINACHFRRELVKQKYEEAGMATEHEYEEAPEGITLIQLSGRNLFDVLIGELPLTIPLYSQIKVHTGNGRFIIGQFLAELADSELSHLWDQMRDQRRYTGRPNTLDVYDEARSYEKEKRGKLDHRCLPVTSPYNTPSCNLQRAEELEQLTLPQALEQQIAGGTEEAVASRYQRHYVEFISKTLAAPRYFVKRLLGPNGMVFYQGAAASEQGPWETQYKDDDFFAQLGEGHDPDAASTTTSDAR